MENTTKRNNIAVEDGSSIDLVEIWHLIWDHKWWYVACTLLCLAIAAFNIYRSPSIYSRTAKVIIDEGAQEASLRDISSFTGSMSRYRFATNVDNEVEALASPDLMEEVAERLGLLTTYVEHQPLRKAELGPNTPVQLYLAGDNQASSFRFDLLKESEESFTLTNFKVGKEDSKELEKLRITGNVGDTLQTPVGKIMLAPTIYAENWDRPITVSWSSRKAAGKRLANSIEVYISGKQTSVVVLEIKDKFPSRAENILNSLIDVYNESWVDNKNRSAIMTTEFINDRLVIIEQELTQIENGLKQFKEENNITDVNLMSDLYANEASRYADKTFEAQNQLYIAQFIKEYLNNPANMTSMIPANSGITSAQIESQISRYNELILRRDALLSTTTDESSLISDLNQSLESIKTAILQSIDNYIATLEIQVAQLEQKEDMVMAQIANTTSKEFDLISIERQQKVKEQLYVYLLQKREENELASLMHVGNTRLIMAPAGTPGPVAPRKMVILLIAIIAGLGIPFLYFFLRRATKTSVETKRDLTDVLSLPYLAEIPLANKKTKRVDLRRLKRGEDDKEKRPIVVKAGSRNVINESFRVLRTNVDLMLNSTKGCKVVMCSSLYQGSGKTFISINLASSMAIKGSRSLVLDLDMRKASLSNSFDLHGPGVAAYLSEQIDDIDSIISEIGENLYAIGVGTLPPNPSELLLSDRYPQLIQYLRGKFDYVFIDCPPAEVVVDASIISTQVDMTAFIIRAGMMDKRNLPVVEDLYNSGKYTRMTVIFNGFDAGSGSKRYGSYGHYGRGYGYGYGYGYAYGNDDKE